MAATSPTAGLSGTSRGKNPCEAEAEAGTSLSTVEAPRETRWNATRSATEAAPAIAEAIAITPLDWIQTAPLALALCPAATSKGLL
mmetsp:Transcript_58745/g.139983  ORF Transcript_58745/g.139983 Transcript_58745/m.139983 type:complete len:86 (+) Transcript_58745:815-1072(+)